MDNKKISILREYFDWLKDDEFFDKFEVLDRNTCLVENEKIEIFRKYNCYLKKIMVQYYKSIKKNKKSRKE